MRHKDKGVRTTRMEVKGMLPLPADSHDVSPVQYMIARYVCPRSDIRGIMESSACCWHVSSTDVGLAAWKSASTRHILVPSKHLTLDRPPQHGWPAEPSWQRSSVCDPVTRVIAGSPCDIVCHVTPRLFVEFLECDIVDLRAGPLHQSECLSA